MLFSIYFYYSNLSSTTLYGRYFKDTLRLREVKYLVKCEIKCHVYCGLKSEAGLDQIFWLLALLVLFTTHLAALPYIESKDAAITQNIFGTPLVESPPDPFYKQHKKSQSHYPIIIPCFWPRMVSSSLITHLIHQSWLRITFGCSKNQIHPQRTKVSHHWG